MNLKQIASDFSTIPVFQKISVYQSAFSIPGRIEQIGIHFSLFFAVLLSISLVFYIVRQVWQKLKR
jgi:hypothetical protein